VDTLQTALNVANSGDQLILADGIYTGSGSSVLDISTSIMIRALNMGRAVLDGQDSRRVVYIRSGIVDLQGLDITGGHTVCTMAAMDPMELPYADGF
jgi:hypothetical protein